ncbi:hypothetical protein CTAM01_05939 [Colletotrichum tamarilloi]|uniref:Secreted protein n=1 Tax=Colletotrichum tamarilloi TaxID=1209934 RepID=A0ABQ9RCJ3_9PEZI|nr:uncharacterized protein CTAM01_05939 [Colletotrichum tamarilloi]KAK1501214.1 hypothetical protein CTAM01_05939 [Colletotrichum tamarilloi]
MPSFFVPSLYLWTLPVSLPRWSRFPSRSLPALDVSFLRNGFRFPGLPCFSCVRLPSGNDHLNRPVRVMAAGAKAGAGGHNQIASRRSDRACDTHLPN